MKGHLPENDLPSNSLNKDNIVLATFSSHPGAPPVALLYIYENMGELKDSVRVKTYNAMEAVDVAKDILSCKPVIVGLGMYVWNKPLMLEVAKHIKSLNDNVILVAGGSAIVPEDIKKESFSCIDHIIIGEGEFAFSKLSRDLLEGSCLPDRIIFAEALDLKKVKIPDYSYPVPYDYMFAVIETTRGCVYNCDYCSFCSSSYRTWPLPYVLDKALSIINNRDIHTFGFLDSSLNVNTERFNCILELLLKNYREDLLISSISIFPKKLDESTKSILKQFPKDYLLVEIGIQTLNEKVLKNINRNVKTEDMIELIEFLKGETKCVVLLSIIFGLPGEDIASIRQSFNCLYDLNPDVLVIHILKNLAASNLERHSKKYKMIYDEETNELLENALLNKEEVNSLKYFIRVWSFFSHYKCTELFKRVCETSEDPFNSFMRFTIWLDKDINLYRLNMSDSNENVFIRYLMEDQGEEEDSILELFSINKDIFEKYEKEKNHENNR